MLWKQAVNVKTVKTPSISIENTKTLLGAFQTVTKIPFSFSTVDKNKIKN